MQQVVEGARAHASAHQVTAEKHEVKKRGRPRILTSDSVGKVTRLQVLLSPEGLKTLRNIQKLSGATSLVDTIRAALGVYDLILHATLEGKQVFTVDSLTQEKTRIQFPWLSHVVKR